MTSESREGSEGPRTVQRCRTCGIQVYETDRLTVICPDAGRRHEWDKLRLVENTELREGVVTVYANDGSYLGCLGEEKWQALLDGYGDHV